MALSSGCDVAPSDFAVATIDGCDLPADADADGDFSGFAGVVPFVEHLPCHGWCGWRHGCA